MVLSRWYLIVLFDLFDGKLYIHCEFIYQFNVNSYMKELAVVRILMY